MVAFVLGVLTSGCGNDKPSGVADSPTQGHIDPRDACATPNAGCACKTPARVVECGQVQRKSGGQTWCSVGHRTCGEGGEWGECEIEGLKVLGTPAPGQRSQALGSPQACDNNPCDPFCQQIVDSGSDIDLPPDFQETSEGGITLLAKPGSLNETTCTGIEVVPSEQTLTVTGLSGTFSNNGLLGEYFDSRFGDDPIPANVVPLLTRLDVLLDFTWPFAPAAGMPNDNFSVRWTGWILPRTTQPYQLCSWSDDGIRVWLGDEPNPIIDNWGAKGPIHCGAAPGPTLTAGKLYKVRVEFYEAGGGAKAQLSWRHAGAPAGEVIPSANLFPPDTSALSARLQVMPSFAQLTVHGLPAGCFDGAVRAVWNLDRAERAIVDDTGKLSLLAAVAGDIEASAYVGNFSAKAAVKVKVNVTDDQQAPPGAQQAFAGGATGTDPMTVLYPYADTVFPLGLRAPTIQWDSGGKAAQAVQISLRAPATGEASFVWNKRLPDADPGRFTVPQEVWSIFEASAKGQSASYSVQRMIDGGARPAVVRPIGFATAPVRGKIYYTQYGRNGSTSMMVADPGSPSAAASVFASDNGGDNGRKCPVCHSVSASGSVFATSDRSYSSNGGLSRIESDGSFTLLSDFTATASPYRDGAQDFRGFAWAPLTPDGKYALTASNIWGNSLERVVGIDPATRSVALPGGMLSGGVGTGLLARYYSNTDFSGPDYRRTDPKIDFAWAGASPGGAVPASFSVTWAGEVQAYSSEPYTFEVTSSGGFRLRVDGVELLDERTNAATQTFTETVTLTRGEHTPIELEFVDNGGVPPAIALRWSTPTIPRELVPQTQLYPADGWHGLLATYYDQNDFTAPFIVDRLESNVDADWGTSGPRPMPSGDDDNWSAVYRGQIEAPASGELTLCLDSSDDATLLIAGVVRINQTGAYNGCAAPFTVVLGTKYDLELRFREATADASLRLSWALSGLAGFTRETVPRERLSPPAGWAPPAHGLTATYYDTGDFNRTLPTGARARATSRIEQNADLVWGDSRPEFSSALTDNDDFSSRLTGQLEAPCSGMYELEVAGSDGGRLWLDDVRVVHLWSRGTQRGAQWLEAGKHDLKLDHRAGTGSANLNLRWKAECLGTSGFVPVPNANLYPSGDRGTAGYVLAGGDNGNDQSYFVWQTPTTPGSPALDVTADGAGRWGLGATVMMVPSFAPDGSKLVFVDGDSAGGNGWRKGLSTFSFDQAKRVFKDRKTVVSTWPLGDALKWPVFESDSRSVIYQATVPGDACCQNVTWPKYGYMGPSNYFEDPGRLFSVDTQAASAPVELANLNRGERPLDRNKSYQATMLPQAAGGYRWAVFTSTRPYGNTLNQQGQQDFSDTAAYTPITEYTKLQSMLWVAAVDDAPSGSTDRSHPAFFLPNQNFDENASNGYLNERAYWVAEACHAPGNGAASACDVDEDCCGGSDGSAVCRIDTPVASPPTRHCFRLPTAGSCAATGAACVSTDECCTGNVCVDGTCGKPPAFSKYEPGNFERVYVSNCLAGQRVDWTFFDYRARVPEQEGAIEFYAESSDDPSGFQTLPVYPAKVELNGVALLGVQGPPGDSSDWTRITLDQPLAAAGIVERKYLKITMRFAPNRAAIAAPVLKDFRQSFSCPPGE